VLACIFTHPRLQMKILVTGASGLIGRQLVDKLLAEGHTVNALSRKQRSGKVGLSYFKWDIANLSIDNSALEGIDSIIHLAGAPIAQRWTKKNRDVIMSSRVNSAHLLLKASIEKGLKLQSFISASGIGIYLPNTGKQLDEDSAHNPKFIGQVCVQWEAAAMKFKSMADRIVINRISPVLAKEGALKAMVPPFAFRAAPYFGNGKQMFSWMHINDVVNWFYYSLTNDKVNGAYNLTSGSAVSQRELNQAIARAKNIKVLHFSVPKPIAKMALGSMHTLVTDGMNVGNKRMRLDGFVPQFIDIDNAVKDALNS